MTEHIRLNKLIKNEGVTSCITLIIPLTQKMPGKAQNIVHFREISKQALAESAKSNDPQAAHSAERLKEVIATLDINQFHCDGIAILVGPQHHEIIELNGPCKAKSQVGTIFALTDVIQGIQNQTRFWVLLVSKKYARLFLHESHQLTELVTPLEDSAGNSLQGFPLTIVQPEDKVIQAVGSGNRGDSYFKAEIKHFFQLVDSELKKVLSQKEKLPVIICGTPEYIELFKTTTHHSDVIAFDIPHDYSAHQAMPAQLKPDIAKALSAYYLQQEKEWLHVFEESINKKHQACGMMYVWETVSTGRVHTLLLEPDLPEVGKVDPENPAHLQIFSHKNDPSVNNISDLLIYEALRHDGHVHIVQAGSLKSCKGVGAILRY